MVCFWGPKKTSSFSVFGSLGFLTNQYNAEYPKYPDPSKVPILRTRTPAIQVPTPALEGPRILRVRVCFFFVAHVCSFPIRWKIAVMNPIKLACNCQYAP